MFVRRFTSGLERDAAPAAAPDARGFAARARSSSESVSSSSSESLSSAAPGTWSTRKHHWIPPSCAQARSKQWNECRV